MNFLKSVLYPFLLFSCTCRADESPQRTTTYVTDACQTVGCYEAGHIFTAYMNRAENRCEEFYQYSCGAWQEEHHYPEGQNRVSVLSNLTLNHELQLRSILEVQEDQNDPDYIKKIKGVYQNCSNTGTLLSLRALPLVQFVENYMSWPLLERTEWSETSFDWLATLITLRDKGFSHDILFSLSVTENPLNTSAYIIKLDRPSFGLNYSYIRDYLMADNFEAYIDSYSNVMESAVDYFLGEYSIYQGKKLATDNINSEISMYLNEVLNFEVMLANISRRFESSTYTNYTIQTLMNGLPQVDWLNYFNSILVNEIDENETIIINSLDFLINVINLIETTNKRTVANYIAWRVIHQSLRLLDCDGRSKDNVVQSVMWWESPFYSSCYEASRNRWKFCISLLSDSMRMAVRAYYMKSYLTEASREDALNMTEYIREAFISVLLNSTWMDEITKAKAIEKVQAVQFYISYKRELLNDSYVNDLYRNLVFNEIDGHFEKVLKIRKWLTDNNFSRLRSPTKIQKLKSAPRPITYDYTKNKIIIRAGMIQGPFFIYDRPKFINFGALGSLIARELAHAVVGEGRRFDINGNNVEWWSNNATQRFKMKSRCIIRRYWNYVSKAGVTEASILDKHFVETVADTMGLKAAYQAYKNYISGRKPEARPLSVSNFTPNQLYWISAAHVWCEKLDPSYLIQIINTGSRIPQKFRVDGPMSTLPEFAEDFQCPKGKDMNPIKKCELW